MAGEIGGVPDEAVADVGEGPAARPLDRARRRVPPIVVGRDDVERVRHGRDRAEHVVAVDQIGAGVHDSSVIP
jgi:hypothetical protein